MRKLTFLLLALCLGAGAAFAQDAGKLVKTGSKALAKYVADAGNTEALQQARTAAQQAVDAEPELASAWLLQANTNAAQVNTVGAAAGKALAEFQVASATGAAEPSQEMMDLQFPNDAAEKAIAGYAKAHTLASKATAKKKAVDGMQRLSNSLSSIGNMMLTGKRYADMFQPLKLMLDVNDYYVANELSPLFAGDDLNNQKYLLAVSARQAEDQVNAKKYYGELYEAEHDEPAVYAGYSQILVAEGDEEAGIAVLSKGRERYPDNSDILFAEINYYIQKEDYTTLEKKLQEAIAREPDNVGLYTALGNVYMNLSQEEEDEMKSSGYLDKSVNYFNETIKRDEANLDATYSIGSLYFNKAVAKAKEMNSLGTSKADQKRYDELNAEISSLFDEALPYFEKAEKLDPNDRNTLIALKEIYARRNDFEKSKIYKDRLDAIDG